MGALSFRGSVSAVSTRLSRRPVRKLDRRWQCDVEGRRDAAAEAMAVHAADPGGMDQPEPARGDRIPARGEPGTGGAAQGQAATSDGRTAAKASHSRQGTGP